MSYHMGPRVIHGMILWEYCHTGLICSKYEVAVGADMLSASFSISLFLTACVTVGCRYLIQYVRVDCLLLPQCIMHPIFSQSLLFPPRNSLPPSYPHVSIPAKSVNRKPACFYRSVSPAAASSSVKCVISFDIMLQDIMLQVSVKQLLLGMMTKRLAGC